MMKSRRTCQAVSDVYIDSVVTRLTGDRITRGMKIGTHQGQWGSVGKLMGSERAGIAAAPLRRLLAALE